MSCAWVPHALTHHSFGGVLSEEVFVIQTTLSYNLKRKFHAHTVQNKAHHY